MVQSQWLHKEIYLFPNETTLKIDDYEERGYPAGNAYLDETVFDQNLGGTAATLVNQHVLQIAQ